MKEEKKPHVHAELIKKWADDPSIQLQIKHFGGWVDLNYNDRYDWCKDFKYRIKPKTEKVDTLGIGLFRSKFDGEYVTLCLNHDHDENKVAGFKFIKWLYKPTTIEVEIEE